MVFTLVDDGAGNFTFTLKDQVDHHPLNAASGDKDAWVTLDIAKAFVVTDFDGDLCSWTMARWLRSRTTFREQRDVLARKTVFEDGLATALSRESAARRTRRSTRRRI